MKQIPSLLSLCLLKNFAHQSVALSREPVHTFEEVDLFPAVMSRSGQSESCVQVIGNVLEAHVDFSRVVLIQHTVVKPPVFGAL